MKKSGKSGSAPQVPASVPAFAHQAGTRIGEIAEQVGGNVSLAKICGVSESSIRNWRRGESEPSLSDLRKIADAGGVTVEWLVTGVGEKLRDALNRMGHARDAVVRFVGRRSTVPEEKFPDLHQRAFEDGLDVDGLETRFGADYPPPSLGGDFVMVPRYDVAGSAGHGALVHSEQIVDHLAFRADWVRNALGVAEKNLVLIGVKGDSMEPTLSHGDLILVDRSRESVEDSGVYVIQLDGARRVKRIQHHLDGSLTVKSDNPQYGPERVAPEAAASLRLIGRVVWFGRRL